MKGKKWIGKGHTLLSRTFTLPAASTTALSPRNCCTLPTSRTVWPVKDSR